MRFLYVAISYPDVSCTTNMYTAFVHELAEQGHEVRVIAPDVHGATRVEEEGGVPVLRVRSGPLFNTGLLVKGINNLLLNDRYSRAFHKFWADWQMDWVITSTPPITLSPLLRKIKKRHGAKAYLILRDIFPQNARDLGLIKNPLLFSYFRWRERNLYKTSDLIGCMSPGNIDFLRCQDPDICPAEKLRYFPNWIKPSEKKIDRSGQGSFRERFQLEGKFITLFGGNFGKPQRMEFILDLAERVRELPDAVFVLIGDGTEKSRIKGLIEQRGLRNVRMFDRLPHEEYQSLINEADIGLVNLSEKFTIPNIPSRTLGYWDASLPVLAATDPCTDLKESMLDKYQAGLWAETGNLDDYYRQFIRLYKSLESRRSMGWNGRKAVETDFSVTKSVRRFLEHTEA
jgi:glycosyltransferase involved in cell wall biosynthesis